MFSLKKFVAELCQFKDKKKSKESSLFINCRNFCFVLFTFALAFNQILKNLYLKNHRIITMNPYQVTLHNLGLIQYIQT